TLRRQTGAQRLTLTLDLGTHFGALDLEHRRDLVAIDFQRDLNFAQVFGLKPQADLADAIANLNPDGLDDLVGNRARLGLVCDHGGRRDFNRSLLPALGNLNLRTVRSKDRLESGCRLPQLADVGVEVDVDRSFR